MNQKSVNMLYLGVFLCLVCAIAAGVMGSVAVVTKEPIAKAKMKKISDGSLITLILKQLILQKNCQRI